MSLFLIGLMNTLGRRVGLASWKELWDQLISEEETDEYLIDNTLVRGVVLFSLSL